MWGRLGVSMEHHFRGEGAGVFIHQLLPVLGQGLPAQRALPGRHQTSHGSWEQLLGWIHQGASRRQAVAPQLCDFGAVTDSGPQLCKWR